MTLRYLTGDQDTPQGRLPVVALAQDVPLHRLFRYPGADWHASAHLIRE